MRLAFPASTAPPPAKPRSGQGIIYCDEYYLLVYILSVKTDRRTYNPILTGKKCFTNYKVATSARPKHYKLAVCTATFSFPPRDHPPTNLATTFALTHHHPSRHQHELMIEPPTNRHQDQLSSTDQPWRAWSSSRYTARYRPARPGGHTPS